MRHKDAKTPRKTQSAFANRICGYTDSPWVKSPAYPNCSTCNSTMNQFIFQIESGDNIPYTWGDMGAGYIIQCPEHKEQVALVWQC